MLRSARVDNRVPTAALVLVMSMTECQHLRQATRTWRSLSFAWSVGQQMSKIAGDRRRIKLGL